MNAKCERKVIVSAILKKPPLWDPNNRFRDIKQIVSHLWKDVSEETGLKKEIVHKRWTAYIKRLVGDLFARKVNPDMLIDSDLGDLVFMKETVKKNLRERIKLKNDVVGQLSEWKRQNGARTHSNGSNEERNVSPSSSSDVTHSPQHFVSERPVPPLAPLTPMTYFLQQTNDSEFVLPDCAESPNAENDTSSNFVYIYNAAENRLEKTFIDTSPRSVSPESPVMLESPITVKNEPDELLAEFPVCTIPVKNEPEDFEDTTAAQPIVEKTQVKTNDALSCKPPPAKKARLAKPAQNEEEMLKALSIQLSETEFVKTKILMERENRDFDMLRLLLPMMKNLSNQKKINFKIRMQETLWKYLKENSSG